MKRFEEPTVTVSTFNVEDIMNSSDPTTGDNMGEWA